MKRELKDRGCHHVMAAVRGGMPVVVVLLLCGCATTTSERQRYDVMRDREVVSLKTDLQRLSDRVDGMIAYQEDLASQLEALRAWAEEDSEGLRAALAETERVIAATQALGERMREELVRDLTRKIQTLMPTQQQPRGEYQEGYEHIVKSGETLSEIARAYHVKVAVIVKANNLASPDSIRVGQKLFIPE